MRTILNIAAIAALVSFTGLFAAAGLSNADSAGARAAISAPQQSAPPFAIRDSAKIVTTDSGLKYYIVSEGVGNRPKDGNNIIAHYHGMLADGSVFDSSFERGQPFDFKMGKGQVIKGWDEGFKYLRPGAKAILIIPPDLGYGARGSGDNIPPNATLYFHVELLGITG